MSCCKRSNVQLALSFLAGGVQTRVICVADIQTADVDFEAVTAEGVLASFHDDDATREQ